MYIDNDFDTEIKLLILYLLGSINSSMDSTILLTFLLENNYAEYMLIQQYIGELTESNLICLYQNSNKVYYKISDSGKQTLEFFSDRLDSKSKLLVDTYFKDFKDLEKNTIQTSFNQIKDEQTNEYTIECTLAKNLKQVFSLDLHNIKEEDLPNIKDSWESNKLNIYKYLKESLLQ